MASMRISEVRTKGEAVTTYFNARMRRFHDINTASSSSSSLATE